MLGDDVTLQAGTEALFDISSSPLADFHKNERLQIGVSPQVCVILLLHHNKYRTL